MKNAKIAYRCILNDDGDGLKQIKPPHDVNQLAGISHSLTGTPVDCLCLCVADNVAYYNSKAVETIYDLYEKRKGISWVGNDQDLTYTLHRQGIDYIPLMIDNCHKAGIDFFASFRMNDTHLKSYPDSPFAPEFWRSHPEFRIWGETDAKSYYDAAMDYSHREVREPKLAMLAEVARNYAVDGIELDMSRTPYYFQPDEAWDNRDILTEFVRQVRAQLDEIGRDQGRKIALMVRTLFSEDRLRHGGMDLRTWISEDLLDILVLTDLTNTFRADCEPWVSLCKERGIPLYPSIEGTIAIDKTNFFSLTTDPSAPPHNWTVATRDSHGNLFTQEQAKWLKECGFVGTILERGMSTRAIAQNYCSQDVSGLYLFNMFPRPNGVQPPQTLVELFDFSRRDKRYHFWQGLPIYVEALRPARYHQTIEFPVCGEDIGDGSSNVTLGFRQVAIPFPHAAKYRQKTILPPGVVRYTLNGVEVDESCISRSKQPAGRIPSGFKLKSHELIELRVPGTSMRNGVNTLAFSMPHAPTDKDPYVYIYELDVTVRF